MTKVCHVTSVHPSHDVRTFVKECTSLAKNQDYEVFLVAKGQSYDKDNVKIIGAGDSQGSRIKRIFGFTKAVIGKSLEIDADIYHLHDPELLLHVKKIKRKGKIVIFDRHESYPDQIRIKKYIPKILRNFVAHIYDKYEKSIIRQIDAVIVPAPGNGKNPFEGIAKNTVIIGNMSKLDELYNKFVDTHKEEFIACYVGSLSEERGLIAMVDACIASKTKFIIAGGFSSAQFREKIEGRPGYDEFVSYRGRCNREEVRQIYKEASCGLSVLNSVGQYAHVETLATKVYEYMSMGLPVILHKKPFSELMVKEYGFGIAVESGNVCKIAEAIVLLKDYKELSRTMGMRGRETVLKFFNWEVEEQKLFALYANLIASTE
jgi:glycosyltransferase involved in cell wall biosynthesis